jgi:hypothetical protein
MCQPFGTDVTAVCRLPHAKAITGQIMLYLENFNKAAKCRQNRGPGLGGVMPLRLAGGWGFFGRAASAIRVGPGAKSREVGSVDSDVHT